MVTKLSAFTPMAGIAVLEFIGWFAKPFMALHPARTFKLVTTTETNLTTTHQTSGGEPQRTMLMIEPSMETGLFSAEASTMRQS